MRVLLLEDDDVLRESFAKGLGASGVAVDDAATLQGARALLDDASYDAAVLDRVLPNGDEHHRTDCRGVGCARPSEAGRDDRRSRGRLDSHPTRGLRIPDAQPRSTGRIRRTSRALLGSEPRPVQQPFAHPDHSTSQHLQGSSRHQKSPGAGLPHSRAQARRKSASTVVAPSAERRAPTRSRQRPTTSPGPIQRAGG